MDGNLVVTKANRLIEASYRLNVNEQRVMALLVTKIMPDDEDFMPYRLKVADLENLVSDGPRKQQGLYSRVKELTRGLQEKVLQIREPDGLLQVSWLSSAKYIEGRGEVALEISPQLKPYLLQLKERFTTYKLRNIVKMNCRYSIRFYELLKQYETLKKRGFELLELRQILGLVSNEYAAWFDFKRNVIEPARRELPEKTDIGFDYTARKSGRAVTFVEFDIFSIEANKPPKKKTTKQKTESSQKQAEKCYRENRYGTACDVQDLAALNGLTPARREICFECPAHQQALFDAGAA